MNKADLLSLQQVLSAVKAAGSVLLFCHVSPDGDTLGTALALRERFTRMGKQVQVMLDGVVPTNLTFLPGVYQILSPEDMPEPYDLAMSVDVADIFRMGRGQAFFESAPVTAVLDHHGTNPGFGHINAVDGQAAASALLAYRLMGLTGHDLNQREAVCLYTALSTDTGNFVYESTDAECFRMMADLMEAGLPLSHYARLLFRQREEIFVRLLGLALPSLRLMMDGRVAGLRLTYAQRQQVGAGVSHTDGIVDYAITIQGVGVAYFVSQLEDGRSKISLRAMSPYRVDEIAQRLGGGGHRLAAGVTLAMPMDEAVTLIESKLCEVL